MKKSLVFIMSFILLVTSLFSFVPYRLRAEENDGQVESTEISEPQNVEDVSDDTLEVTDEESSDLLSSDGEEDRYLTISQDPSGDIIIRLKDQSLVSEVDTDFVNLYRENTSYSLGESGIGNSGYYYTLTDESGTYYSIPMSCLRNLNVPSGDVYVSMYFNHADGSSNYEFSNTISINGVDLKTATVNIEETNLDGEMGLAIYADSDYLDALCSMHISNDENGNAVNGGRVSINNHVFQNYHYDYNDDLQLIRKLDCVWISEKQVKSMGLANTDDGLSVSFYAPGYTDINTTLSSLSIGTISIQVDFEVTQNENGDIIITSDNKDWLRALTIPHSSYGQGSSINLSGNGGYWYFDNSSYTNYERYSMVYDEYNEYIYIPYDMVIDNGVLEGAVCNNININAYGYTSVSKDSSQGFSLAINKGVVPAPTDITVNEAENGDIIIQSSDTNWLSSLACVNQNTYYARSSVFLNDEEGAEHYSSFRNDRYDDALQFTGISVILSNEYLLNRNIVNGNHKIYFDVRGYEQSQEYDILLTHAKKLAPNDVTLTAEIDKIIISSQDTDWISAIFDNQNAVTYPNASYISIYTSDVNNGSYLFGALNNEENKDEIAISDDGKSLIIDKDVIYKKKVMSANYTVNIIAKGYMPYRYKTGFAVTTTVKSIPEDIKISYNPEIGLVVSSTDTSWINGIYSESGVDDTAFIKMKRFNPSLKKDYDYSYYAGTEYIQHDGNTVYIPIEYISGYTIQNNYYVTVGSYGYEDYISPQVYIGDVDDVPYDLRIKQEDNDVMVFTGTQKYLNGLMGDNGSITFYIPSQEGDFDIKYATGDASAATLYATGNAPSSALKAVFNSSEYTYDQTINCIVIDADTLQEKGISAGNYEILFESEGYCKGTLHANLTWSDVPQDRVVITFDANGGTLIADNASSRVVRTQIGESIQLPLTVKENSKFLGWYDGETKIEDSYYYTASKTVTLKAGWEALNDPVSILLETDGGKLGQEPTGPEVLTIYVERGDRLPDEYFYATKDGCDFIGWFFDASYRNIVPLDYTFDSDSYICARHYPYADMLKLRLEGNGGIFEWMDGEKRYSYSETRIVPGESINYSKLYDPWFNAYPTLEGYTLEGWKDSSGTLHTFDEPVYEDTTYYASWYKPETITNKDNEEVEAIVVYDDTAAGTVVNNDSQEEVKIVNTSTGSVIIPSGSSQEIPETNNGLGATTETELYNVVDVDTNVPTSISLVVDDSDAAVSTDDQQTVKDALDDEHNKEEVLYFDAELVKNENGNETTPQPKTPVTITIELPSSLLNIDENVIRVFEIVHVKQDGSTETLPATLNGSQLSFTTGSFSPFAVVYKDKEKESATITLRAGAISLKGQIGVDFKLDIPDELLNDDTKIIITNTHQSSQDASSTLVFKASDYELEPSTNRKIYSFYLPVRRMADDLNIHAEDKDGNRIPLVTGSGVDYTDTGFTYSGLTYIHNQLNKDTTPENLKSFLRNLENFSNAARILFGYEAEGLSVDRTGFDDINATLLESFDYSRSGSEPEGLKHKSVTLELKSETKIIHKFQLLEQDKSIDDYEFYVGDRKVTPFEEDGLYIIEVENIRARDLDEFYTVSVKAKGADDIAYSMDYAALSYAYRQLSKSGVSEDLIDVVKSLYIYSNAANDYFENN